MKTTKKPAFVPFSHLWLSCTLKGHSSRIVSIDFSPNGKYMLSASEGRYLCLVITRKFYIIYDSMLSCNKYLFFVFVMVNVVIFLLSVSLFTGINQHFERNPDSIRYML